MKLSFLVLFFKYGITAGFHRFHFSGIFFAGDSQSSCQSLLSEGGIVNIKNPKTLDHHEFQNDFPYRMRDIYVDLSIVKYIDLPVFKIMKDLQFIRILSGTLGVEILEETIELEAGDVFFLNSNTPHRLIRTAECHYQSFQFPAYMLSFYSESPADVLVSRMTSGNSLPWLHIRQDFPGASEVTHCLDLLTALESKRNWQYYHYAVLTTLAEMWLAICILLPNLSQPKWSIASVRMRTMLLYIQDHYAEDIRVPDIAESAGIGRTECGNIFQRCLCMTPILYLTDYRLMRAAELLKNTDEKIGLISRETGFHHVSHFIRRFESQMRMSPRYFRIRCRSCRIEF